MIFDAQVTILAFMVGSFCILLKKSFLAQGCETMLLDYFFSRSCLILSFTFEFMIPFTLFLNYGSRLEP